MKLGEIMKAAQNAFANGKITQDVLDQILATCRQLIKLRDESQELERTSKLLERQRVRLSAQKEQLISEARDAGIDISDIEADWAVQ
jgi:hypothetical protein